jgi:hypothetical protein
MGKNIKLKSLVSRRCALMIIHIFALAPEEASHGWPWVELAVNTVLSAASGTRG